MWAWSESCHLICPDSTINNVSNEHNKIWTYHIYINIKISYFWHKTKPNTHKNIKRTHFPKTFRVKMAFWMRGGVVAEGCTHFNKPGNCFKTCSGFARQKHFNHTAPLSSKPLQRNISLLPNNWHQLSGCAIWESADSPTRTWGSNNAPPPPASLHENKMLSIINWDASVFSSSGISATLWESKTDRAVCVSV